MFINSVQLIRNGFIHDKPISLRPRVTVVRNNENIGTSKHRGASGFVSNALMPRHNSLEEERTPS